MVAGSALWSTLLYAPQPGTGHPLYVLRLVFGPAMTAGLVLGFTAIRRHDIVSHRAWMIRAYAIGPGAGTQVFTEGIGGAVLGTGELRGDLAKGAGWVINLAVAEWVIRRPSTPRTRRGAPSTSSHRGRTLHRSTVMTTAPTFADTAKPAVTYEFQLAGHLDDHWSAGFGGATLIRNDDASTTLTVEIVDQAQLHGLLARIRDVGVTLLSLNPVHTPAPPTPSPIQQPLVGERRQPLI